MPEQYTYTELLFAHEIRLMAHKLRRMETPSDLLDSDDQTTRAELAAWDREHPLTSYYARCVGAVTESADAIRDILKAK